MKHAEMMNNTNKQTLDTKQQICSCKLYL